MAAPKTYLQKVDFSNTGKWSNITYTYILRIYEISIDVEKNISKLFVQAILKSNHSGDSFWMYYTTVAGSIDNVEKFSDRKQRTISGTDELVCFEWEGEVKHNDNGSKTIEIDGRVWQDNPEYFPMSGISITDKKMELTTIPRASNFGTISGNTIGSAITINIDRKSDVFTHSLWYSFGSKTWQGIASGVGTSQSFTPPLSLCSEIPNDTSGQMTLILRTYNGGKQVGSDVYKTINVNVPSSVIPTIGGITVTENVSDIASKAGVYIQGLSKLNLAIANAVGVYGSSVESYKITFEGRTYTSQSAVTGYISGYGNLVINAEITDSRGRKGTAKMTINVVAYSPPKFSGTPTAARQSTATNVLVTASGSVSSVKNGTTEKNKLRLYVLYKTASTASFPGLSDTYKVLDTSTLSFSETTETLSNISATSSYDIRVLIQDNFKQIYWDLELGTEIVIGDINRSGWGIGKYHENGILDVGGDIYSNGEKVSVEGHTHSQYLTNLPAHTHDYAASNHSHSTLSDRTNGTDTYLNYGASGISNPSWFAAWNGYELRAISPANTLASLTSEMTQNVLWTGTHFMSANQTANLSQSISSQRNGIVLIWQGYKDGQLQNQSFSFQFIPKAYISYTTAGYGVGHTLSNDGFYWVGSKYLYVFDTYIKGNDANQNSGSDSGIEYYSNRWVLVRIVGF